MSLFKNILALCFGLVLIAGVLYSADRLYSKYYNIDPLLHFGSPFHSVGPGSHVRHPYLLWGPVKNGEERHHKKHEGKTVFDVVYHYDHLGLRVVPAAKTIKSDQFLIFMGGSNAFGSGLTDEETIANQVQLSLPDYKVYNFAYRGYGPQHMRAHFKTKINNKNLPYKSGVFIYQYMNFHFDRALGAMNVMRWAGANFPYYDLENDRLVYKGSFGEGRFLESAFYWMLSKSAILRDRGLSWPRRTSKNIYYLCKFFTESKERLESEFPSSRFIVLVGPMGAYPEVVEGCFKKNSFETHFVNIEYEKEDRHLYRIPNDGHLTALSAKIIAAEIKSILSH